MTRVTIDAEMLHKLHGLAEPLELCDESGRVVGRVFPAVDLSDYEPWEPEIDEAELQRREQNDPRYSTQEVLDHLKGL